MASLAKILSLDDFEKAAERHLPAPVYAYVNGGVEDNVSRTANRAQFLDYDFVPRMLVSVANRSLETKLFDTTYAYPFGIAPIGMSALYAYRGDLTLARAARDANAAMCMSGSSLIRMEDVAAEAPGSWFQVYLPGNREQIEALVARVGRAGFKTLVFTADCPVAANRENNVRAGFSAPLRPSWRLFWSGVTHPAWSVGSFLRTCVRHGMPHFENNFSTRGAPILSKNVLRDFSDRGNLDWDDWDFVRAMWKGRLVIKGVLHRDDARIARDRGADGIWVSNHGGRQLDGAIAPLRVLPEIVEAVPDIPVMIDSGFRRGTDVLKALALGAKFDILGRPFGYAASVGGEEGVKRAFEILAHETRTAMAMIGVNRLEEMSAQHLRKRHSAR
jgi:L-lactate dehydrogenase (cytochrome)